MTLIEGFLEWFEDRGVLDRIGIVLALVVVIGGGSYLTEGLLLLAVAFLAFGLLVLIVIDWMTR